VLYLCTFRTIFLSSPIVTPRANCSLQMAPQLSEHVLVSLLRQCFTTHACRTSRIRRQTHFGGSKKALHTEFRSCSQLRPAQQIEARLRDQGQDELSTDVVASLPQTKFKFLNSDEPHEYYPSSVLSRRQNTSHGRGQQPKKKQHVAVLGGGITGLSAVHYLLREFPNAEITLYEGSDRLGGWLHSKQVDVGNGYITLEQGPRTLRPHSPAGLVTLEMVCSIFGVTGSLN
jgi:oxygen-dependent protoporphyrinogen oxidase